MTITVNDVKDSSLSKELKHKIFRSREGYGSTPLNVGVEHKIEKVETREDMFQV